MELYEMFVKIKNLQKRDVELYRKNSTVLLALQELEIEFSTDDFELFRNELILESAKMDRR